MCWTPFFSYAFPVALVLFLLLQYMFLGIFFIESNVINKDGKTFFTFLSVYLLFLFFNFALLYQIRFPLWKWKLWNGEFIFQCHIFLLFHSVHGVLKVRMLKWFAFSFSSEPCFVRTLYHDPSILGGPTWQSSWFHWVRQDCDPCDQFGYFSVTVVFILSVLWWMRIRDLWKLLDGRTGCGES